MNDATESKDHKEVDFEKLNYTGTNVDLLDQPVDVRVKLNRHERRKRAKLARLIAMKEYLEMEKRRKSKGER